MTPDAALRRLYDEHAAAISSYCLRVTASPESAEAALRETFAELYVEAVAGRSLDRPRLELLAVAREACLRHMAPPSANGDRAAGRGVEAMVRAANAQLPPRQREVLAVRETEDASYADIGELMGLHRNAVAQLTWRARLNLSGMLREGSAYVLPPVSGECEQALMQRTLEEDGPLTDAEQAWLAEHLESCLRCAASHEQLRAAAGTYGWWVPAPAAEQSFDELLAHAASVPPLRQGEISGVRLAVGALVALAVLIGVFALARAEIGDGNEGLRAGAGPKAAGSAAGDRGAAAAGAPARPAAASAVRALALGETAFVRTRGATRSGARAGPAGTTAPRPSRPAGRAAPAGPVRRPATTGPQPAPPAATPPAANPPAARQPDEAPAAPAETVAPEPQVVELSQPPAQKPDPEPPPQQEQEPPRPRRRPATRAAAPPATRAAARARAARTAPATATAAPRARRPSGAANAARRGAAGSGHRGRQQRRGALEPVDRHERPHRLAQGPEHGPRGVEARLRRAGERRPHRA